VVDLRFTRAAFLSSAHLSPDHTSSYMLSARTALPRLRALSLLRADSTLSCSPAFLAPAFLFRPGLPSPLVFHRTFASHAQPPHSSSSSNHNLVFCSLTSHQSGQQFYSKRLHSTLTDSDSNAFPLRLIVDTDWYPLRTGKELRTLWRRLRKERHPGSVTSPAATAFFQHREVRRFLPHAFEHGIIGRMK
jgi:hypothetical protein